MFKQIENLLEHQDFDSTENAVEFATKISLYYLNLVTQAKYTEDAIVFSFSKISVGYQVSVQNYDDDGITIISDNFSNHLVGEGRDYFEALSNFIETMQVEIRSKIAHILGIENK